MLKKVAEFAHCNPLRVGNGGDDDEGICGKAFSYIDLEEAGWGRIIRCG
jgi:hypothetical protein